MKKNNYLYGTDDVPQIPWTIIAERLELLDINLATLLREPMDKRDTMRIRDIIKARDYWLDLSKGK